MKGCTLNKLAIARIIALASYLLAWTQCFEAPADDDDTESHDAGAPRADVDRTSVDLGERYYFTPFQEVFRITNTGSESLRLKLEGTSCDCITNVKQGLTIAPGATEEITVGYRPEGLKPRTGRRRFTVALSVAGEELPPLVLSVLVDLVLPITVSPTTIDFGTFWDEAPAEKELTLTYLAGRVSPGSINIQSSSPALEVIEVTEEMNNDRTLRYIVRIHDAHIAGHLRETLVIRSDSKDLPIVEIPVRASLDYPVVSSPPAAMFGLVEPDTTPMITLTLTGKWEDGLPKLVADTEHSWAQAKVEKLQEQLRVHISLDVPTLEFNQKSKSIRSLVHVRNEAGITVGVIPVRAVITHEILQQSGVANIRTSGASETNSK